jgi:hypothetical protein
MKDCNGREVRLGDRVKLWDGKHGTVVCSIDTKEFSAEYPESEWSYLKSGIVIRTETNGLFHYIVPDEDFEVVGRSTAR